MSTKKEEIDQLILEIGATSITVATARKNYDSADDARKQAWDDYIKACEILSQLENKLLAVCKRKD